jgi:8-oxo-dGTP pyrophosphatase MutT (NUDIX family)
MWDRLNLMDAPPEGSGMAAVLAPLFEDEEGLVRVVFTKRPETMPTHAGHISFPGGRPDPQDRGPVDTALREAHEEVGIAPEQVEVLGFLPRVDTVEFKLLVVPVVGRIRPPVRLAPSEREVAKIYTPLVEDLADEARWSAVSWDGRQIWHYDLGGDILWGATARMVRVMLDLD